MKRLIALAIICATLTALATAPARAAVGDPEPAPALPTPATVPVTGSTADGSGIVNGTFTVDRFVDQSGQLAAVGTFTGAITSADGTVVAGSEELALPVAIAQQAPPTSCSVLHLDLGPLDLNLLGLVVHLDEVVLDITAQPGPGNLLGNLLCSLTGLLDGGLPLNLILGQVLGLLNQILGGLLGAL